MEAAHAGPLRSAPARMHACVSLCCAPVLLRRPWAACCVSASFDFGVVLAHCGTRSRNILVRSREGGRETRFRCGRRRRRSRARTTDGWRRPSVAGDSLVRDAAPRPGRRRWTAQTEERPRTTLTDRGSEREGGSSSEGHTTYTSTIPTPQHTHTHGVSEVVHVRGPPSPLPPPSIRHTQHRGTKKEGVDVKKDSGQWAGGLSVSTPKRGAEQAIVRT